MEVLNKDTKDKAKDFLGKPCFFSNNLRYFSDPNKQCQLAFLDGFKKGEHCFQSGNPKSVWKFCLPVTNDLVVA